MINENIYVYVQEAKKASLELKVKKGFSLTDGPFVKGLDNAFNVHRQRGIFVSNNIHKTLQVMSYM